MIGKLGQRRLGRALVGGSWGQHGGRWHRADAFGWLIPERRGVHLLCCAETEHHAGVWPALAALLRALVSPADALSELWPAPGSTPPKEPRP
jgi:hypothetical protein